MNREEMKHIHKVNEVLASSGYQILVHQDQIHITRSDDDTMVPSQGSQDARRHFGDIDHHGDHHGRHRTLQAYEQGEGPDNVNFRENKLAHIDPFND